MEKKGLIPAAFLILVALGSGFFSSESLTPEEEEVTFESSSEYQVLTALENEMAQLTALQANKEGVQVTTLPEYVTRYAALYAGEREPEEVQGQSAAEVEKQQESEGVKVAQKIAYLTFDDGPSELTPQVLDVLKEQGIKATFFLVGEEITAEREETVRRMVQEGHTIGLHTYSHDYAKLYRSVDSFLSDYEKAFLKIYEVTGIKPVLYRFPGGSRNAHAGGICREIAAEMERRGFCYYDWNVSAEDSVGTPTAYSIRTNIFKDVYRYNEPVVLMHDSGINRLTLELLPEIIHTLKESGYEFGTLENRECCQFSW
ncbi:MAG: polysaccharide deacetylase [Lachnospiraceae bacterium]|nr:polysaccharide deacetylase [Lachnospiraceae bacterium]